MSGTTDYAEFNTEFLRFWEEVLPDRKTKTIRVVSRRSNDTLGTIAWYGAWRQYTLYPAERTIWNPDCLRSVIRVIAALNEERRLSRAS